MECGNYFSLKFGFLVFFLYIFISFLSSFFIFCFITTLFSDRVNRTKRKEIEREKGLFSTANQYTSSFSNELFKKKKGKRKENDDEKMCPASPSLISYFLFVFPQPLLPCDDVTSSTLSTRYTSHTLVPSHVYS